MAFSTRATKAAAAAAMLTPQKIFGGEQDASAKQDIAAPPLSPASLARMSNTHAEGAIMEQLRLIQEGQQRMQEEQQKGHATAAAEHAATYGRAAAQIAEQCHTGAAARTGSAVE